MENSTMNFTLQKTQYTKRTMGLVPCKQLYHPKTDIYCEASISVKVNDLKRIEELSFQYIDFSTTDTNNIFDNASFRLFNKSYIRQVIHLLSNTRIGKVSFMISKDFCVWKFYFLA